MKVLLVTPPPPAGISVMRTYAAGFGTVQPDESEDAMQLPPLELATMAAVLRDGGHAPTILDTQSVPSLRQDLLDRLRTNDYAALISPISLGTLTSDCEFLRGVKSLAPGVNVCVHTSSTHQPLLRDMLQKSTADLLLLPDSAIYLPAILGGRERANTAWLDAAGELRLGPREQLTDVDRLPIPARDMLDNSLYRVKWTDHPEVCVTTMNTSYGCPYPCSYYCPYPLSEGSKMRFHSTERVMQELEEIRRLGIDGVIIRDPLFTKARRRTVAICEQIQSKGLNLKWSCETRIDCLDAELLRLMKASGCVSLEVGVETADEAVMPKAKQGLSLDKVRRFKSLVDDSGINCTYLFMLGLPPETRRSVAATLLFILELRLAPAAYNLSIITPYPGTPLYFDALARGWIEKEWSDFSGYEVVMHTDHLSAQSLREAKVFVHELRELLAARSEPETTAWSWHLAEFIDEIKHWAQ